MSEYMTLVGTEDVSRAGYLMRDAAQTMASAAAAMSEAAERIERAIESMPQRVEEIPTCGNCDAGKDGSCQIRWRGLRGWDPFTADDGCSRFRGTGKVET